MRRWAAMGLLLLLTACMDNSDLGQYVAEVKARPASPPDPMPEVNDYVPEPYRPGAERSPFVEPVPEMARPSAPTQADCVQPDPQRPREPLERYSLDNLSLRGTLADERGIRALVRAQDGVTHSVGVGDRLGLNQGEVLRIGPDALVLREYLADGKGCWEQRETTLELATTQ